MRQVGALDLASLERFQTELIEAGFESLPDDPTAWVGPIAEPLKELTTASTMRICFRDGWPFQHPRLFVEGLDQRHVNASGEVCLWQSGASSGEWLVLSDYTTRIEEWVRRAKEGFHPEDFALDAHLYFESVKPDVVAAVELGKLGLAGPPGKTVVVSGSWDANKHVLKVSSNRNGEIEGRCYWVGHVPVPPHGFEQVRSLLTVGQARNFDRRYRGVAERGELQMFLVAWQRELGREVLVLLAGKQDGEVVAESIEVAPTDVEYLKLRAGPDVNVLGGKHVAIFGLGAVGSNLALRLAEAGVTRLTLVDDARLRPGDIVRHAAGSWAVGSTKVGAVSAMLSTRAPWTEVVTVSESSWDPKRIEALLAGADLTVEATGAASLANMLSVLCERKIAPLVSAALYRGGAVARVRRQALADDVPMTERTGGSRYPPIPPADEPLIFEPGCSSPVNNASPVAVAAIAALTAQVAIDFLAGRDAYGDEVIEVYRPLEVPPFDRIGRIGA